MSATTKSRAKNKSAKPKAKAKSKSVKRLNAADKLALIKKEAVERETLKDLANNYASRKKQWEACKTETKSAKQDMDAAFLALYEAAKSNDPMLPFTPQPDASQARPLAQTADSADTKTGDATDADKTAFDAAPLADLPGLTKRDIEMLEAADIRNGKALQAWFAAKNEPPIKGFGQGARDRANDAMARWYENRAKGSAATAESNVDAPPKQGHEKSNNKAKAEFINQLTARMNAAGRSETGIKAADNETALKLVRYLSDDPSANESSRYTNEQLDAMGTRLDGLTDDEVGNIIGVKKPEAQAA